MIAMSIFPRVIAGILTSSPLLASITQAQSSQADPQTPAGPAVGPASTQPSPINIPELTELTLHDMLSILEQIWNYPLFNSGGNTIRLNQLVIAALIVLIGIFVSKWITKAVHYRLIRFRRVNANAAAVIQRLTFYLLIAIITLIALPIAGIPITVFTILGGALAIGIGFGAQNLFNNMISGLILMTERPIRLGDIVEIGEHEGRIEAIGTRSTRVRRFDGVDVLVPNSHFLEQPVVNWTLFDAQIRGSVAVGVAYGSPTEQVAAIMKKAAEEHEKVSKYPSIEVIFQEFGDNALIFEVFFWTTITRPMDLRMICSDIRFHIDKLCREQHISIAFPQRDVHLTTLEPLQVQIQQQPGQ